MGLAQSWEREHHWDGLRAFLMLLGIPYHVALAYRPGQEWIVHSGEGASVFTYVAELIHLFRMPAFFVVAGYLASRLLMRRDPGPWLAGRLRRLGVPLLAGLALLVPVLNMACELSTLSLPDAMLSFQRNAATSGGYWVRHLWFLIVLIYCSLVAALAAWRRPVLRAAQVPPSVDRWVASHFAITVLGLAVATGAWQAVAIELFYKAGLATNIPQEILRLDDLIASAPYFILGWVMARAPRALAAAMRVSPALAAIALLSLSVALILLDWVSPAAGRFLGGIAAVTAIQLLIALACLLMKVRRPLVDRFVAASFVIYLFHLPIAALLVTAAQNVAAPLGLKVPAIMLATLILSLAAWDVVRRSAWLSFLFSGGQFPIAAERSRLKEIMT